jgi:hypothetical protein
MASRFLAVSRSVSPLAAELCEGEMFTASALRRLAAISNEVRVRVEFSKNRLMTVLPRRVASFLTGSAAIAWWRSARSRITPIAAASRSAMPTRWRCANEADRVATGWE